MSKLLTIGIDASRANQQCKTGVQWYAYHVIQTMKKLEIARLPARQGNEKLGGEITFVLYTDKPLEGEFAQLSQNWEERILRWPPGRLWTQIRLSWEMLCNPPDVLFVPSHVFPIIHPKKTVMMVHDVGAIRFPESYHWFQKWYTLWSAHAALKRLWKVVVPSEFTKNELTSAFGLQTSEKIQVIQHGYDERYHKIENQIDIGQILDKYLIKRPFILSVGRLEEKKNTVRLIKAFELLKKNLPHRQASYPLLVTGYSLLLVGSPGHGYEKVCEAIDASPFKSDIIDLGHVDPDDLVYILNAAEVFVFPSLYEGFGLPILESMACGTPVIASRENSCEEVGGDAAVYVDPENVEDIAQKIHQVMSDAALRGELIQKGFERVKSFSWEKCAEETLQLLLES